MGLDKTTNKYHNLPHTITARNKMLTTDFWKASRCNTKFTQPNLT